MLQKLHDDHYRSVDKYHNLEMHAHIPDTDLCLTQIIPQTTKVVLI